MSEPIIIESYRHDHWPSRHERNKTLNYRIADLKQQGYVCEVVPKEEVEGGEVKRCELLRAIKYPKPTPIRPVQSTEEVGV